MRLSEIWCFVIKSDSISMSHWKTYFGCTHVSRLHCQLLLGVQIRDLTKQKICERSLN